MTLLTNFRIEGHKLLGAWKARSPNSSPGLVNPSLLVYHYTASGGEDGSADTKYLMSPSAKASAHFVIGRLGDVAQIVECDRKAWHAGKSSWKGRANCNDFSIGIELDNWGWLSEFADGMYRSYTGAVIPSNRVVKAKHKNKVTPAISWEMYPDEQIKALIFLTQELQRAYPSLTEIVGHEDIAPGRKTDPGPAFPWQHVLSRVEARGQVTTVGDRKVNATSLNVRLGPGPSFGVAAILKAGVGVKVVLVEGDWSQIQYRSLFGNDKAGWVSSKYLA